MKSENKASEKGMARESGPPSTVHSIEHVGGKSGMRFKPFTDHPDHSMVKSPQHGGKGKR